MEVIATEAFIRSAKPIAKKYRSFNQDYKELVRNLEENPRMGVDLDNGYRKVRMAIASKGKGKSGGCRVITLDMVERNGRLYLLYAYDKSDYDNIVLSAIKSIAADLGL
ncbi:MAG: type II toxin-antitoxin system RelE/ParE family toxin [Muribaculaceae bacterium]|nr:type II toxin-antitoxin system RelE/ParE family toxin [Muribaculaceae bacterium]